MGSDEEMQRKREEKVRQFELWRCVSHWEILITEKINWLTTGSKNGRHKPVLPVLKDKTTHNLVPTLLGWFAPPSGMDPDRPKRDYPGTDLGALIRAKMSGADLAQNREVLKRMRWIWQHLAGARQLRKAAFDKESIDAALVEAQNELKSLLAYLDTIK